MTPAQTEQLRKEAEARTVLSWPKHQRTSYLELVEKKRGKDACDELKREIMRQYWEGRVEENTTNIRGLRVRACTYRAALLAARARGVTAGDNQNPRFG